MKCLALALVLCFATLAKVCGEDNLDELTRAKLLQTLHRAIRFNRLYCDKTKPLTEWQLKHIEACYTISMFNVTDADNARKTCRKKIFTYQSEDLENVRQNLCQGPKGTRIMFAKCLNTYYQKFHSDRLKEVTETKAGLMIILPILHERYVCLEDGADDDQNLENNFMEDEILGETDPILTRIMLTLHRDSNISLPKTAIS